MIAAPAAAGVYDLTGNTNIGTGSVLRFFGADTEKIRLAAAALHGVKFDCAGRGGETLLALNAAGPCELKAAEKRLRKAFKSELYGAGGQCLPAALMEALEKRGRLLACADAATGALLEPRLENLDGAAKVFDFGALSYAHAPEHEKIECLAARRARGKGPAAMELARVKATLRVVGAQLAAGSVQQGSRWLLFAGTPKACWVREVSADANPALWLMDMLRRLACGLKQAEGTRRIRYGARLPQPAKAKGQQAAGAAKPRVKKHILRHAVAFIVVLALAGLAGSWYITGGNLAALPRALGFEQQLHSGAQLV